MPSNRKFILSIGPIINCVSQKNFAVVGTLVDSQADWSLRVEKDGILAVTEKGTIAFRESNTSENVAHVQEKYGIDRSDIINLEKNEFLMPGLIDSHIHAPQFVNAGLALDKPLLQWLQQYTFPAESRFADLDYARKVYSSCVDATLAAGTTTANYFATIHREATEVLCDIVEEKGQRALVGKVCMNRNGFAEYVESTTSDSLNETELFLGGVASRKSRLVEATVMPRFAVSCDRELMTGLGSLAKKFDVRIHTHLAETKPETAWVKELEPWAPNYTDVYAGTGLLTDKTLLAHAIYLSDGELSAIASAGAGVAHCPNSNCSIRSGSMDARRMAAAGIRLGLGTDCSAGYSPSVHDNMKFAIATSNHIFISRPDDYAPLSFADAIFLATRGSAQAIRMDNAVGALEKGLRFDALRVRMDSSKNLSTALFGHESVEDMVQKFVFVGDDRNIAQVWVEGCLVKDQLSC